MGCPSRWALEALRRAGAVDDRGLGMELASTCGPGGRPSLLTRGRGLARERNLAHLATTRTGCADFR